MLSPASLILIPILGILIFGGVYGGIVYSETYYECLTEQSKNENLLRDKVCRNVRMQFDMGLEQKCADARTANMISPRACAWKRMWTHGEVMRLWKMATDSDWKVYGALLFIIGLVIHQLSSTLNHALMMNALKGAFVKKQSKPKQVAPVLYLENDEQEEIIVPFQRRKNPVKLRNPF